MTSSHKVRCGDARTKRSKDEWLTPPHVVAALGRFDLDPCSPIKRPWPTARKHYTTLDDGLKQKWRGRVWLNPPYGGQCPTWIARLVAHGNGIALVAPRIETKWFQEAAAKADGVLYLRGRLSFCHIDGTPGTQNPFASVLLAFGARNASALKQSGLPGLFYFSAETQSIAA